MTKKIQEIALSFFLIVSSFSILFGMVWLKPVIESQQLLIEETRINQKKIMQETEKVTVILTELGYALTVTLMAEERMIKPSEANKMIKQSITTIDGYSERLGKLAAVINEARVDKGHKARRRRR